jgi:hypothetical protein
MAGAVEAAGDVSGLDGVGYGKKKILNVGVTESARPLRSGDSSGPEPTGDLED